ncbi:MAG: zinc-ribbon domain-containing protein [Actinomycetota bacterium]
MFCPKCGVQNEEDAKFCQKCGQQLTVQGSQSKMNTKAITALILSMFGRFLQIPPLCFTFLYLSAVSTAGGNNAAESVINQMNAGSLLISKYGLMVFLVGVVSAAVLTAGVILGVIARMEIAKSGGTLSGKGLSNAAIIVGDWIGSGLLGAAIVIVWTLSDRKRGQ